MINYPHSGNETKYLPYKLMEKERKEDYRKAYVKAFNMCERLIDYKGKS